MIKMAKKGETAQNLYKNYRRKIKSPFTIYVDFESILVQGNNGKQNTGDSYTNKYQNYVGSSFGYKLVCVNDQFSKPLRSYLGKDGYKFTTNMVQENKYCSRVMKKHFTE